jgi:4'-phosphopantetheinyl transferase EntD
VAVAVARALPQGGAPPGCDLELEELPLTAARFVLGPEEAEWLGDAPARLLAVFSAKEAAWKAFRRTSGTLRDLRAVPASGGFCVHARDDGTSCARVRVHVLREGGVFSWVRG